MKTKNVNELLADLEPADFADVKGISNLEKVQVQRGDLLINLTGAGSIGRVSIYYGDDLPITNQHIARLGIKEAYDEGYVAAFLRTWWGERALEQGVAGSTGQINMVNDHVRSIPVVIFNAAVQKYIGDKVRQAERLQACANALSISIAEHFAGLVKNPIPAKFSWVAKKEDLDSYRINPKQYDPVVLDLIQRAKDKCARLDPLSALVGVRKIAGGATPKGAKYFDKGVLFARVQNVKPLRLDLSDAVYVDPLVDEELARSRCSAGDIILTITGYPGTASLVTEEDLPVNINQHSVRFNIKEGVDPGYVCAALNSRFLKYQVDRLAIGGTRDALDYPSVGRLLIPRYESEIEKNVGEQARCVNAAIKLSQRLTTAAKLLVEALIKAQLTEAELLTAEKALQAGSDRLDRFILSRLNADGVDGQGPALFSDLDELYYLLTLAKGD
ncbi:hypothetical protein DNK59_03705 [Pseudomonas sp. TKO26]|nr:hypothetical protein DNK62_03705 [Pseudomonas sp. TKO30]PYY93328.1 hypothetical protein DNK61_03705 [Pseudomonas sp. TKO29]PYY95556.1 hypothetical protein DNK59_03705 [Pseudomonas sp. TKO26]PYZ01488.1 hypothetical protein DNK60_03705 [Pseudomonas sp. TKO14]